MPPIANHGLRGDLGGFADQLEPGCGSPLLRGRLPDRADADVVDGALGGRLDLLASVRGEADDRGRTHNPARLARLHVVLAHVDTVRSQLEREIGIVVDDEERRIGVGEPPEGLAGALDDPARELSVAQLDQPRPTAHRGVQHRFRILLVRPGVADEVKPSPPQPLPTQIADCLGGRKMGRAGRVVHSMEERRSASTMDGQREPTNGLRGRLKRRRPSEPDPGNAGAGRLERLGRGCRRDD